MKNLDSKMLFQTVYLTEDLIASNLAKQTITFMEDNLTHGKLFGVIE